MPNDQFIFRKQDRIGVTDAENDRNTLLECFVDTGDYEAIANFSRPERFILGRTGSGKTALITKLKSTSENVIFIQPEGLSLSYVANSNILRTVADLGVDLDLFFRLLWRHVLGVEILKHHFNIDSEEKNYTFLENMKQIFINHKNYKKHMRALNYLRDWGDSFWKETDSRVKELTTKLTSDIEGAVQAGGSNLGSKLRSRQKLSEEERVEVVYRAQEVVNRVQMKELTDLMKMLDDAIGDRQRRYFLVIDKLDEKWVEDKLRYRLIRALIETVRDFTTVERVKPLVVLRVDLINRVYDMTRDSGFQEEKFTSLNLPIRWTKSQLISLLDKRIDFLVKQRYTSRKVTHKDLLPITVKGVPTIDYMLARTLMRPRDLIQFFNICIEEAVENPVITEPMILRAEREYSRDRLASISDEWQGDYPQLAHWHALLKNRDSQLLLGDISLNDVQRKIDTAPDEKFDQPDKIEQAVNNYLDDRLSMEDLRNELVRILYNVGLIGIQIEGQNEPIWSHQQRRIISNHELDPTSILHIQPTFWAALNVKA